MNPNLYNPKEHTMSMITVQLEQEDAARVHALLSNRIDTEANWMTSALLRGDVEAATGHARERNHLQTVVRAAFRGAAMDQLGTDAGLEAIEART